MKCKPCEAHGFHCDTGAKLKLAIEAIADAMGRTDGNDMKDVLYPVLKQIAPEEIYPGMWS